MPSKWLIVVRAVGFIIGFVVTLAAGFMLFTLLVAASMAFMSWLGW